MLNTDQPITVADAAEECLSVFDALAYNLLTFSRRVLVEAEKHGTGKHVEAAKEMSDLLREWSEATTNNVDSLRFFIHMACAGMDIATEELHPVTAQ
jgi:hypothetical protein